MKRILQFLLSPFSFLIHLHGWHRTKKWVKAERRKAETQRQAERAAEAVEDSALIRVFYAEHRDFIERYQYSPINGNELVWHFYTEKVPPFDTRTGKGGKVAKVRVREKGYISKGSLARAYYSYDSTKKRLEVFGPYTKTQAFD
ncbi:hypothetical protein [Myxococcus phage Mx1]|nr:hypothetical protein [Myxococcus phage Mx1]